MGAVEVINKEKEGRRKKKEERRKKPDGLERFAYRAAEGLIER